ncbi:MAG: hypothetical protein C0200_03985 [Thermoproteota archaeon]|nr:MAG: hypothetical protein C0200_03985 [Candidatus Korarchaeota archaeon]
MRISVSGTRGKTTTVNMLHDVIKSRGLKVLSKTTGEKAVIRDDIEREILKRPRSVLYENLDIIKSNYDVIIIENQAITPYTMKAFNMMVKPEVIIITNVRLDHTEFLGESREEIAKSFCSSFVKSVKTVISGERKPEIEEILMKGAGKVGADYIKAENYEIPGSEAVGITEAVLYHFFGEKMDYNERNNLLRKLDDIFSAKRSGDLFWYNGAKINDPDSAEIVLNYLRKKYNMDVVISANLRGDRRDRTAVFSSFFRNLSKLDWIRRIFVSGPGSGSITKLIGEKGVKVKEDPASAHEMINFATRDGLMLVLLVNRRTKMADILIEKLSRGWESSLGT